MIADSYKRGKKLDDLEPPRRPAFFWWLLANVIAACFAVVSWIFCLHVFGNPEIPRNYEILKKLGRLPELKRYTVLDVPDGNGLDPSELYARYFGISEEKRNNLNSLLLRNYLRNFERSLLLNYVEGEYQVSDVRKLTEKDIIHTGFAIRAQALVRADDFSEPAAFPVVIEYIFPTEQTGAADYFDAEDILEVKKNPNCAAVVHVSKVIVDDEPVLQITAIPIAYGPYQIGEEQSFKIEPPKELNPAAGLPVWK